MTYSATVRMSNAERTEISNALVRHFADGRLDEDELNERLARIAAAKTRAEVTPLFVDLPPLDPPPPGRFGGRPRLIGVGLIVLVGLVAAASSIRVVDHVLHPHVPWLLVALVAVVVVRRSRRRHSSGA